MKSNIIKRMLASALTASLVMAPAISAAASSGNTNENKAVEVISSSTSGTVTTLAAVPATSQVAGVRSTVSGVYLATSVNGCAITTPIADISAAYGLADGEKAYAKFFNLDPKKSTAAMAVINGVAAAKGAVVGPCINIELGKMSAGKYSLLASDGAAIRLSLGIPKTFAQADKSFAIIRVREGGLVDILEDIDTNPDTITFDTTGGAAAYAIIKY